MITSIPHPARRAPRRPFRTLPGLLVLVTLVALTLGTLLDSAAQSAQQPIRVAPTATPTEEPGLVAQPTEEPTREPERVSPTEVPDAPVATEEPQPAAPSSLTLHKGACDDAGFDPSTASGLQSFLDACHSPDGEFEFTIANEVAFSLTASTELGDLFTQVPTGPVTITETIPAGWGDPAVFCWSNLFPTPSDTPFIGNSPVWNVAEGEDVECWWFNVAEPEAQAHTIRVEKRVCPEGFAIPEDYWTLVNGCQETMSGVGFAMTTDGGTVEDVTDANGEIEWAGIDLGASGQVQLDEDIPDGYGEPVVWCVNFPVEAADAQDFDFFQVASVDGLVSAIPEQDEPYVFHCTFFNVRADGAPDDLVNPAAVEADGHDFYLDKHECPEGFDPTGDWQAFSLGCTTPMDAGFNVTDGQGPMFQETAGGHAEWLDIDFGDGGDLVITETIPEGYGEPVVFCSILPAGAADPEDFDTQQMVVANGRVTAAPVLGEQDQFHCAYFNMLDGGAPDSLVDPGSVEDGSGNTITVTKRSCPMGVTEDADPFEYLELCPTQHNDVDFTLSHDGGVFPGTTAGGEVQWTGVPTGNFSIQETVPPGYVDPMVFCFSTEPVDGLVPLPELVTSTDGLVSGAFDGTGLGYECWWLNIQDTESSGGLDNQTEPAVQEGGEEVEHRITLTKRTCPAGTDASIPDLETLVVMCPITPGVEFTLTFGGGATSTSETDAAGAISWDGLPYGEFEILETHHAAYAQQVVWCEYEDFGSWWFQQIPNGIHYGEFKAGVHPENGSMHLMCDWFNGEGEGVEVKVIKHRCPLGVPEDTDLDTYRVICAEDLANVPFTLAHAGGSFPGVTDGAGEFEWAGVDTGDITIEEDVPPGFKDPLAFCGIYNGEEVLDLSQVAAPGGLIAFDIPDDATEAICWFFNIQDPDYVEQFPARVVVNKRLCDAGVDFVLTEANTIDDIIDACPTEGDGIEFTLDNADGSSTQAIAGGDTYWDGVPAGPFTLTEDIPAGYGDPIWYCTTNLIDDTGGLVLGAWGLGVAPGGVLGGTIASEFNETFGCWVFNVPADDGDLVVLKRICPPGYDVHTEGADPLVDCPEEAADGIQFQFGQPGLGAEAVLQATGDVIDGGVAFTSLEPGAWKLVEFAPEWVESAFVGSCTVNGAPVPADPPLNEGFEWEIEIEAGEEVVCAWYNVPHGGNSLTVHKKLCPVGFDVEVDNPEAECTEPVGGVTFQLGDMDATTGDDQGVALFEDVPAGEHDLTEDLPEGIAYAFFTHCTMQFGPVLMPLVGAQPPVATLEFDLTSHWECYWYNVPGDDEENTIIIHKWQCPEGAGTEESLDWYEDNCTDEHDGVDFKVTSDLGIAVQETSGGQVQFDGLPAGTAGIQETIPDGFGAPIVFCAPEDSLWMQVDAPTGHWDYDFLDDGVPEMLTCYVFNIPGEPPDLTILKWTCPPGYDLMAAGADPAIDCTEATNGIAFELRFEGNPALEATQTTGDVIDGGVLFDDLEPDVYNVAELVPDGIAAQFTLECTGHIMGMLQPYPLQFGPVLDDIDLDAGEHLVCHWYNVPEVEGGDLTLIKYTCSTEEFVSDVDCQIEEDGKTFDLFYWTGTWDLVDTATSDGVGRIQWTGLGGGEYWFEEHDGVWCHIASDMLYEDGPWVVVPEGVETIVHVYNCDGTPGEPGDTPTKYPNTGVPPASTAPVELWQPGGGNGLLGPFSGLIGIAFLGWQVIHLVRRVARQREERGQHAWRVEQAAAQDRSAWLAASARTARPGWMTTEDGDHLSRPPWMKREPLFPDSPE